MLYRPQVPQISLHRSRRLRASWGYTQEVKGSQLAESQVVETAQLLQKADAFVEIYGIDTGLHSEQQIRTFQKKQAHRLLAHLTPQHDPIVVTQMRQIKRRMLALSPQLFAQFMVVNSLMMQILEPITLFHVLRNPQELGEFRWTFDNKGSALERLWSECVLPFLGSSRHGLTTIDGADYSYFDKFITPVEAPVYAWTKQGLPQDKVGISVDKILEDWRFVDSKTEPGLQLADIVVNAFRRALRGSLQSAAWPSIGALIIGRQEQAVTMLQLPTQGIESGTKIKTASHSGFVLQEILKHSRSMFPENN